MSLDKPPIEHLLEIADNDRFLLCSIAAKRAKDINDMMHGQRERAISLDTALSVNQKYTKVPLTIAFEEIDKGDIGYIEGNKSQIPSNKNKMTKNRK